MPPVTRRLGLAAFVWGLLFAAAHVYWALGGTALLGDALNQPAGSSSFARESWTYVIGWALLSALFLLAGLFPLALSWGGTRTDRRRAQAVAVLLGYAGMASLALFGIFTREIGLAVLGSGACTLGGVVALFRPHGRSVAGWTTVAATWGLGAAMALYGCGYVAAAVGEIGSNLFLVYLITGGASWLGGGALFLTTAWFAASDRRSRQPARRLQAPLRPSTDQRGGE